MQASRGVVWICLILPTTVCVNICEVISTQEALLGLGVQGFNDGLDRVIEKGGFKVCRTSLGVSRDVVLSRKGVLGKNGFEPEPAQAA